MFRTLTLRMVPGLPAKEVRAQLKRARRLHDAGKQALAFYLFEMQTRRLYQETGHESAVHYAVARLGMKRRSARDLVVAGRNGSSPSSRSPTKRSARDGSPGRSFGSSRTSTRPRPKSSGSQRPRR